MRSYHVIAVGIFLAAGFVVAVLLSPDVRAHLHPIHQNGGKTLEVKQAAPDGGLHFIHAP
jgi:hypothetical protein